MGSEVESLQNCLKSVTDPRKRRGVRFPLVSMLLMALVGLLARQTTLQAIIDHAELQWAVVGPALGFVMALGVPHATT